MIGYNVMWLCEDFRLGMRNLSYKPKTQQVQTKIKLNLKPQLNKHTVSGLWLFNDKLLGGVIKPKYKYYGKFIL